MRQVAGVVMGVMQMTVGDGRIARMLHDHPRDRAMLLLLLLQLETLFPFRSLSMNPLLIAHPHGFEFRDHPRMLCGLEVLMHVPLSLHRGLLCIVPRDQL